MATILAIAIVALAPFVLLLYFFANAKRNHELRQISNAVNDRNALLDALEKELISLKVRRNGNDGVQEFAVPRDVEEDYRRDTFATITLPIRIGHSIKDVAPVYGWWGIDEPDIPERTKGKLEQQILRYDLSSGSLKSVEARRRDPQYLRDYYEKEGHSIVAVSVESEGSWDEMVQIGPEKSPRKSETKVFKLQKRQDIH